MASSPEFMQSVAARLEDAGTITYRKMFGEYCVYCDGKLFGCVCDDRLFVKITEPGGHILDPFAGSGTTVLAAVQEGYTATGIEVTDTYAELARERIRAELEKAA